MDEDELELRQKSRVKTQADYDTFGDTAAEMAKKAAAADAQARPSLIPGPVFQDLIAPVPDSVGEFSICCLPVCFCWTNMSMSVCTSLRKPSAATHINDHECVLKACTLQHV